MSEIFQGCLSFGFRSAPSAPARRSGGTIRMLRLFICRALVIKSCPNGFFLALNHYVLLLPNHSNFVNHLLICQLIFRSLFLQCLCFSFSFFLCIFIYLYLFCFMFYVYVFIDFLYVLLLFFLCFIMLFKGA